MIAIISLSTTSKLVTRSAVVAFIGVLWSAQSFAAGWNDFSSDIGHGFQINKTSSFTVCLGLIDHGPEIICPDPRRGDHGPIDSYVFTDDYLLIKAHGAMPSPHIAGNYTTDASQTHYFIVDRLIEDPYVYQPIGPLDENAFLAHAAVPADLHWESPPDTDVIAAVFGILLFLGVALVIYGWPLLLVATVIVLLLSARRFFSVRRRDKFLNA